MKYMPSTIVKSKARPGHSVKKLKTLVTKIRAYTFPGTEGHMKDPELECFVLLKKYQGKKKKERNTRNIEDRKQCNNVSQILKGNKF